MTMSSAMDDLLTQLRAAAEPTRLRLLALCARSFSSGRTIVFARTKQRAHPRLTKDLAERGASRRRRVRCRFRKAQRTNDQSQQRCAANPQHGDHRLAMSLAVAGLLADGVTRLRGTEHIDISFPGFERLLRSLAR